MVIGCYCPDDGKPAWVLLFRRDLREGRV